MAGQAQALAVAQALILFSGIFTDGGLTTLALRRIVREPGRLDRLVSTTLAVQGALAVVGVVVLDVVALVGPWHGRTGTLIIALSPSLLCSAYNMSYVLKASERMGAVAAYRALASVVPSVVSVVLVALTRDTLWVAISTDAGLLLSAALGVFIAVGNPRAPEHPTPSWPTGLLAVCIVGGVVLALITVAKSRGMTHLATEAVLLASAAGILYGLQDVSTQAALIRWDDFGIRSLVTSPWGYIVVGAAATGILLSQSAFRAAALDYSLPPTAVAEPGGDWDDFAERVAWDGARLDARGIGYYATREVDWAP